MPKCVGKDNAYFNNKQILRDGLIDENLLYKKSMIYVH